jgi:hypothetical protein
MTSQALGESWPEWEGRAVPRQHTDPADLRRWRCVSDASGVTRRSRVRVTRSPLVRRCLVVPSASPSEALGPGASREGSHTQRSLGASIVGLRAHVNEDGAPGRGLTCEALPRGTDFANPANISWMSGEMKPTASSGSQLKSARQGGAARGVTDRVCWAIVC